MPGIFLFFSLVEAYLIGTDVYRCAAASKGGKGLDRSKAYLVRLCEGAAPLQKQSGTEH